MNVQSILDDVPNYDAFLSVDEMDASTRRLHERHSESVEVFEVGRSRAGHPILCLRIGSGPKNALAFGCPHPNEPIGCMTLEYFSHRLARDPALCEELGFTWYIIKCIDPDGTRLNEGWFKGPFGVSTYARNFFRPAAPQQIEWTFPVDYKDLHFHEPLPETQALMSLIERLKPEFMYSLHNAGFGGVYYYISDPAPDLYAPFHQLAADENLPLSLGEPEVPYAVTFQPAIYKSLGVVDAYTYFERFTSLNPAEAITGGASSAEYARRFSDTFTLIGELPYFYDARIADGSGAGMSRRDAVLTGADADAEFYSRLNALYVPVKSLLTVDSPFRKTVDNFISIGLSGLEARRSWAAQNEELTREATVAEWFDSTLVGRFYRGLLLGVFGRMLLTEHADGTGSGQDEIERTLAKATEFRDEWLAALETDLDYRVIPIRSLVRIQLGAALYAAQHVGHL
jgi:hypothetical protein